MQEQNRYRNVTNKSLSNWLESPQTWLKRQQNTVFKFRQSQRVSSDFTFMTLIMYNTWRMYCEFWRFQSSKWTPRYTGALLLGPCHHEHLGPKLPLSTKKKMRPPHRPPKCWSHETLRIEERRTCSWMMERLRYDLRFCSTRVSISYDHHGRGRSVSIAYCFSSTFPFEVSIDKTIPTGS